jgi:hypothetical protein
MSSLWPRSGTIERYADDLPAKGAQAFFFAGGTTTPISVYRDSGQTSAFPRPILADDKGRWPDIFIPFIQTYDVQVKTAQGVQLTYTLRVPNPDPVEVTVNVPTGNQIQTGMIHAELINSTKIGYVRLNGGTIANAGVTSPGTVENHSAEVKELYIYLWNAMPDSVCPVTTGRGISGGGDFGLNKVMTLPDWRGRVPVGLDDMGLAAAGSFPGIAFAPGSSIIPGSKTGSNTIALVVDNIPTHSHTGTIGDEGSHTHGGTTLDESPAHSHGGTTDATSHSHGLSAASVTAASAGDHTHFLVTPQTVSLPGNATPLTPTNTMASVGVFSNDQSYTLQSNSAQPTLAPTIALSSTAGAHTHSVSGTTDAEASHKHPFTTGTTAHKHGFTTGVGSTHTHTFSGGNVGLGTSFSIMSRSILVTWFIKL